MASFASEHVVIWRVLNAKKCSSVILNGFQKFIISKVKCPAITLRFLAVVRAGGRKEWTSGNYPLHEMPNTRSGEKGGWVRSRKQGLLTKISKNRSTATRCLPMVKKKPKIGALPTLNMPKRSHDATKPAARPSRSVVNDNPVTESSKKYYQSFNDLCKRVKTLKTLKSGGGGGSFSPHPTFSQGWCFILFYYEAPDLPTNLYIRPLFSSPPVENRLRPWYFRYIVTCMLIDQLLLLSLH